jgi:hypothetical protein
MSLVGKVAILAVIVVSFGLVGCGGGTTEQPAPTQEAAKADAAAAGSAAVKAHMPEHFSAVARIQDAVIRSSLDDLREPARYLADHQAPEGFSPAAQPHLAAMRSAARAVADAADLPAASDATGALAASCGTCHAALSATPVLAEAAEAAGVEGLPGHMLAHRRAMTYLYDGLVGPSDEMWVKGADGFKGDPLVPETKPKDAALAKRVVTLAQQVHIEGDNARNATGQEARGQIYGKLLNTCADCHHLQGVVIGTGLPKGL